MGLMGTMGLMGGRVWTICGRKGGSHKSSTTVLLAAVAASRGVPVTVVDLDPQGTASVWLAGDRASDGALCDALRGGADVLPLAVPSTHETHGSHGIHVVRADVGLAAAERELQADPGGPQLAANALVGLSEAAGLVLVDTPPALSLLPTAALSISDLAIVVCLCQPVAVQPVADTLAHIERVKRWAPNLRHRAMLTGVDQRLRWTAHVLEHMRGDLGATLVGPTIPTSGDLIAAGGERRLPSRGTPAWRAAEAVLDDLEGRNDGQANAAGAAGNVAGG